jgi:hypothetical protein
MLLNVLRDSSLFGDVDGRVGCMIPAHVTGPHNMRSKGTSTMFAESAYAMPVLRNNSRTFTFRVSSEEYEVMARACMASGSRSLSEFARTAVFEKIEALSAPRLTLHSDLDTLARALGELDVALREASKRICRLLGPVGTERAGGDVARG